MEFTHTHQNNNKQEQIMKSMPSVYDFMAVSDLFKILCDNTRLQMFWILCHVEQCVTNLAVMLDVSSPAISHHVRLLKENNLITSRKDGKEVLYRANDNDVTKLFHSIIEKAMNSACPIINDTSCKRCHTNSDELMEKVHSYLIENLDKRITIEQLAHKFFINVTTLKSRFKYTFGHSIAQHVKKHRMEKASRILVNTPLSISEIALKVGYNSQSKFSKTFFEEYGILPLEYRKKYC